MRYVRGNYCMIRDIRKREGGEGRELIPLGYID